MKFPASILVRFACIAAILAPLPGCGSWSLRKLTGSDFEKADARNPVVQVICLWQPAEGRGLDNLPTRGFAGQIVFLTQNSPTPVEVEGDVRIYLFDDQGTIEEQAKPLHQFDFVGGAWQVHLQKTAWGPTYQLFIPYVRKGPHDANCELRVRLKPPEGRTVFSEPASITLQGSAGPDTEVHSEPRPHGVVQASAHEDLRTLGPGPRRGRRPSLDLEAASRKEFQSYTVPQ